ncbi:hypothetical protein QBC38DRAFT_371529 [Podospora fimiseda]|uniref:Heterokaryon incompatibility domain-containing protein n=1 Tax=Podospora fimiseda TaxID=252190 RepID=A0AAN7BIM3_9PEZI|nr:hypothetical protein QBC38DRAFT_371529 [Podospora fimiseda]
MDQGVQRRDNFLAISTYLEERGFASALARRLAGRELRYWTTEEITRTFNQLHVTTDDIKNTELKSFEIRLSKEEIDAGLGPTDFVKPTWDEIVKSASSLGRLCVNKKGKFFIDPPGGYAALSHVWSQGLGADIECRGLHRSLIEQIFEKLAPLNIEWLWMDSLAIPGSGRHLTEVEEKLKSQLINTMADIYRGASQVIIFDALVLRLLSEEAPEVAAIMCCGKWITRIWTYQEVRLAQNAIIVTESGFVSLEAMNRKLSRQFQGEGKRGSQAYNTSPIRPLGRVLDSLLNGGTGSEISLVDVAFACRGREATIRLDYARGLYPLLGLEWEPGLDLQAAMQKIFESRKKEATRLILYYGPPRASDPGWAPAVFSGVRGFATISPGEWKPRGVERGWFTTKPLSMEINKDKELLNRFQLELESESANTDSNHSSNPGPKCWMYVSSATANETPRSLSFFEGAVKEGTAYILCDRPLISRGGPSPEIRRYAIAVVKSESTDNEAWVAFTAKIISTNQDTTGVKNEWLKWLLLHENPTLPGSRD